MSSDDPSQSGPGRGRHLVACLLLAAITPAVFHRVVTFAFLTWDDDLHILENEQYRPVTFSNLLFFWQYAYIYLYIPISYTFFGVEAWLSQFFPDGNPADRFNPAIFHLGNLLLHLGNVLLTYRLLWRMVRSVPGAFLGAALFAIHPLQVESVAWISETRGTLSTLFSLLAVQRYITFAGIDPERGLFAERAYEPPERRRRDYVWATIYYALALLSKPSASSLPLIVAVIDIVLLRREWKTTLKWLALWFVLAAGITGLTKYYQKTTLIYSRSVMPWYDRPFVAGDAYAFYLVKLAWPMDLAFDHGRTPFYAYETSTFLYAWMLPAGIAALMALSARRRVWLGCYAIFIAAVLPVSGIVSFLYQSISTVADRYMYVPLIGFGLLLAAWTATRRNPTWVVLAAALVLGLFAHRSYEQAETWRDDWSMFGQGLKLTPRSHMAHLHLGNQLRREGRYAAAIHHYREMLKIRSDYYTTHFQIGVCLYELGHYEEAALEFGVATATARTYVDAWCMLGKCRVAQERYDEAEQAFRRAIEEVPESAQPHLLLGETYARQGRYAEADRSFAEALKLEEESVDAHVRYGRVLLDAGRYNEAVAQYEQALALKADDHAAHYGLASALLKQGKFIPAIAEAEHALALLPDDFGTLQTLGMAQAAAGRRDAAVDNLKRAQALVAPASPQGIAVRETLNELQGRRSE